MVTNGAVSQTQWRQIFERYGHLAPYYMHRPDWLWGTNPFGGRSGAVEVAQSMNHPNGGGIFGHRPKNSDEEQVIVHAYNSAIGLGMTHWFQDWEDWLGAPGGTGRFRAEFPGRSARLESGYSNFFDMGDGKPAERMTISFGITMDLYQYGGWPRIFRMETSGGDRFDFVFRSDGDNSHFALINNAGDELRTRTFRRSEGVNWRTFTITVDGTARDGRAAVTVTADDFGAVTKSFRRPGAGARRLVFGGSGDQHPFYFDDVVITGSPRGGAVQTLARYDFESSTATAHSALTSAPDRSGNGITLQNVSGGNGSFTYFPTNGSWEHFYTTYRRFLVEEILAARTKANRPAPRMITNWQISKWPGLFGVYKQVGFTHGNEPYYNTSESRDPFLKIFSPESTARTQYAFADGSPWSSAWLGNWDPPKVPTPEEYKSIISLATLDGNRYYAVFTSTMSAGHLGPQGISKAEAARFNAEALYEMAVAASWFESTKATLEHSRFLHDEPLANKHSNVILRARKNDSTNELWFAGVALSGTQQAQVSLTAARGTLTNLATGAKTVITDGKATVDLGRIAALYHFAPEGGEETPAPAVALTAAPTSITSGQSAILTWSSTNATSCLGTGFATGGAPSGSVGVSPAQTTTYSIACTGVGGSTSGSVTVTVTEAPPLLTMHVANLVGHASRRGNSNNWDAVVQVRIQDANGNAVSGAVVTGSWSGARTGTVSGTTNQNGIAAFETGRLRGSTPVTLTVENVIHPTRLYDESANARTSITITISSMVTTAGASAPSSTAGSCSLLGNADPNPAGRHAAAPVTDRRSGD